MSTTPHPGQPQATGVTQAEAQRAYELLLGHSKNSIPSLDQKAVRDGIKAALEQFMAGRAQFIPKIAADALEFYAQQHHFVMHDGSAWDTVSGEPANFFEDESNTATVEDGSVAKLALESLRTTEAGAPAADPAHASRGERTIPNPKSTLLAQAVVGGAGLFVPGEQLVPPEGKAAVLLYVPIDQMAGKSLPELQADLGLPWSMTDGAPYWFDQQG